MAKGDLTPMRFRTDGWSFADKAKNFSDADFKEWGYDDETILQIRGTPHALPGDTWAIHWYKQEGVGPLAGYAICCPRCGGIHHWTSANNCKFQIRLVPYKDSDGNDRTYSVCGHSGEGSCWNWTGSPEENTLTGTPSLLNHGCGWHGFLTNGQLREV